MNRKFINTILFLICAAAFSFNASAQNSFTIKGVVLDVEGLPVIGAGISSREFPDQKSITDLDGAFSINVAKGTKFIVASFIGMEETVYELNFDNLSNIKIIMNYDVTALEQAVVTGYANTTVKKITGSVGIMNSEKFDNQPIASVGAIMQGEIAGVTVQSVSGRPGVQQNIRIRGVNNLSGNSNPLWVVDGVPMQNDTPDLTSEQIKTGGFDDIFVNGVGNINPNDIESITVLKDAAAAAIYGSRAANGVIVVTTKRGKEGRMQVSYSNNFIFSFAPRKNNNLMTSAEKLSWEQELWDEFSADKYQASKTDNTVFYPIVGIVGEIRAGVGAFKSMKDNVSLQDSYIKELSNQNTDWYGLLFRDTFSHNHHLSLSGGSDKSTYYVSLGYTDDNGMLVNNGYDRYNLTANLNLTPARWAKIEFGVDLARQSSVTPDSYVDPFTYAYFANPYERAYDDSKQYVADNTYFSLPFYNGDDSDILPNKGFSIMRELEQNSTKSVNWATTARISADFKIIDQLKFVGLASYSFSNNKTDKIVGKDTYTAFKDRLGNDKYSQEKLYGSISQNSANRDSYVLRGHFAYNDTFADAHTLSVIAGAEIRGSSSRTIFTKRYNYDPLTGTTSLPEISGETDAWVKAVEALSGEYFTDSRYASFYASADYFYKKRYVVNMSFRSDGSSYFGSARQFNPTWSAGLAWHISEEDFMKDIRAISYLSMKASTGFTGDVSTSTSPNLIMQYYQQQYRYYEGVAYLLGYIPTAPNPNLSWEKTQDVKASVDLGLFKERLTFSVEGYYRMSTDVVTSSQVLSTTGFNTQYYNSADIMNTGVEVTLGGKIVRNENFNLSASVNFAYNFNKVIKYQPSYANKITVKDRYVEGYPVGAIISGKYTGIDSDMGLYTFALRPDAEIKTATDLNKADNYRYFLGTSIAPYTGGFNISASYRAFKVSINGVYSVGAKKYDKISSPASYYDPRHPGVATEKVQSQYSDLYSNHLNVKKDRTDRWTESNRNNTLYPRIYDYFGQKYNFDYYNPMDYNIVDAIYLKDISYMRIKSIIFTYSLPEKYLRNIFLSSFGFNLALNNFFTVTNYDGMDPEVPGATYPTTKSVSFGFKIGF